MATRRGAASDAGAAVLHADDWSTLWRCECGYGNAGRDRCLICGARAPESVQGSSGLYAEAGVMATSSATRDPKAGRRAGRTVAVIIVANLVIQAVELGVFLAGHVERATAIRVSLWTGLLFYGLAAVWVFLRGGELGVRPRVGELTALVGAAEGFVIGGASALFLFAVMRLIAGRPVLDPTSSLLAAQGSLISLILGVVLVVIAAPVVEELVFRGFLAEALAERDRKWAIILSAVAFSLAHLRLAQFRYYLLMGVVLAYVYFRRGLVGSMVAHATFNFMLVLLAVAASHGPAFDAHPAGSTVSVPATYRLATNVGRDDLVAIGPVGAQVEFAHLDLPRLPPAPVLARNVATGGLPVRPGLTVDYSSVSVMTIPAGEVVSMMVTLDGKDGRMVAVPTPDRLWIAVLTSDGSSRSFSDFERMLQTWRLPAAS